MIGLDVGSTTAKMVKFNQNGMEYQVTSSSRWRELLSGGEEVVSTGYFRHRVPHVLAVTEITAAVWGARYHYPEVEVVVDIGGQDTKVVDVRDNTFQVNDKCAAGTGAFLEFVARYLDVPLEELGSLALQASRAVEINTTCGVFALSEVVSRLVEGHSRAEIAAGIHLAFARRIAPLIPRARKIVLIGGAAKNRGMVAALEEVLGSQVMVPEEPQIVNALGALKYWETKKRKM